jgi:hypothetical protein
MIPPSIAASIKEIPYDHVAKFTLQGRPGNRVQDVINISIEGAFVAVAIGYSFIPARLPDRTNEVDFLKKQGISPQPMSTTAFAALAPPTPPTVPHARSNLISDVFMDPRMLVQCLLVKLCGIDFKYSIIDSGTGRELQNQPIHNIAGLGESTGDRPFRPLAKPMLFMPRSTIRIEVEEISEGPLYGYDDSATQRRIGAELFIVLHGYKILGYGTALP